VAGLCLACVFDALGNSFNITASEDSFICSDDYAERNFGNEEFTLRAVGRQNSYTGLQIGRSLYKFQIPSDIISVQDAVLRLKIGDNFAGFPMTVGVCGVTNNWSEYSVTWNNQPTTNSAVLDTAYVTQISSKNVAVIMEFNVTDYISQQIANEDFTSSFILKSTNENVVGGVRWFLRESEGKYYFGTIPGMAPELVLEAIPEPATLFLLGLGAVILRKRKK
jgi:hypothetical protein